MIRFIDLQDQICEGIHEFAFWDTVTDQFRTFCGSQTWESKEEFIIDYNIDKGDELQRYLGLIPQNWPTVDIDYESLK